MKATYKGVSMEGTPKEIHELKRLMDDTELDKSKYKTPYNPYTPWVKYIPGTWYGGYTMTNSILTTTNSSSTPPV